MKWEIGIALAGVVLLSCASAASASLFSSAPKASDSLTLPSDQQKAAWNDLSGAPQSSAPSSFRPSTTSAIPSTLQVHAIPAKTATDIPALRPYDYSKVQGKLLIINPHDMMIAAVITG